MSFTMPKELLKFKGYFYLQDNIQYDFKYNSLKVLLYYQ